MIVDDNNITVPETNNTKKYLNRVLALYLTSMIGFVFLVNDLDYLTPTNRLVLFSGMGLLALSYIIGIVLNRFDRPQAAIIVAAIGINTAFLVFGIYYQGIGMVLGLLQLIIVGLLATQSKTQGAYFTMVGTVIVSAIMMVGDVLIGSAPWRVESVTDAYLFQFSWAFVLLLIIANLAFFYRQFIDLSIRIKLSLSFFILVTISLWGLSNINNRITQTLLTTEAQESLESTASQTVSLLENFINSNLNSVKNESTLPSISNFIANPESDLTTFQALLTLDALRGREERFILSYSISDTSGNILLSTDETEVGTSIGSERYFSSLIITQRPTVSDVYLYNSNDARIYFLNPVANTDGDIQGALIVTYNAEKLQSLIETQNNAIGTDSFGVLFDENLVHLAHGVSPESNYTTVSPINEETFNRYVREHILPAGLMNQLVVGIPELADNLMKTEGFETVFFTAEDIATGDRTNQVVAIRLVGTNWILAYFQPEDIFLAPAESQFKANTLISILITSIVFIIAVFLAQLLTNPINDLTSTANALSEGDLEARSQVNSSDEFGLLATTFNNMAEQLSTLVTGLEKQVADRTAAIVQTSEKLKMAAEIARDATIEQKTDRLVAKAVDLIADRFDLYFAGIYLLDEQNKFGQLVAGSGEPGFMLVDSEHRIGLGNATPISYVLSSGEARLVRDNDPSLNLIRHPVLPNLQEQLVLPLTIGHNIIGAIDLQSDTIGKLTEDDIPVLSVMADQLAIAIQKGELTSNMETTLEELETAYGRYTREAWQEFVTQRQSKGYRFQQIDVDPIIETPPFIDSAWQKGETLAVEDVGSSSLLVPLKLRGQVISMLELNFAANTIPEDTRLLVEEISNRLSLVMENARLVESAQNRVEQEQLTNQITTKMRESLDLDTILKTSIQEISRSLNLAEAEVRLNNDPTKQFSNGSNGSHE